MDAELGSPALPPAKSLRVQVTSGVAGTLGLRVLSLGATFLTTIVLARSLGADGYGVFAWASAWALVIQMIAVAGRGRSS